MNGWWTRRGMLTPALFGLFPLWWALGLGELAFPLFGGLMLVSLLQSQRVSIPRFASAWMLFLVVNAASGLMLEDQADIIGWSLRLAQYSALGLVIPYVLTNRSSTSARVIVAALTTFFIVSVIGGYLGLIVGPVGFRSPMSYLLPAGIRANSFVAEIVEPSLADVETFLGRSLTRPKAPFTFTNGWGAAMGLLWPFAMLDAREGFGLPKIVGRLALLAAVVPVALSFNEGLWVSIIAGIGYSTVRSAGRGDGRAVISILAAVLVAVIMIAATPLGDAFDRDQQNPSATEDRATLYVTTLRELGDSPLIGFGGPRQVTDSGPPAGTHGQLWIVLFSHGAAGAVTYFGFLGAMFWHTRRYRTVVGMWCHTVIFISFVQAPFYGHVPQQLAVIMTASALGLLDVRGLITANTDTIGALRRAGPLDGATSTSGRATPPATPALR